MVCVWVVKETQLLAPITMTTIIYQNYRKQVDFLDHVLGIGQICSGKESGNFKWASTLYGVKCLFLSCPHTAYKLVVSRILGWRWDVLKLTRVLRGLVDDLYGRWPDDAWWCSWPCFWRLCPSNNIIDLEMHGSGASRHACPLIWWLWGKWCCWWRQRLRSCWSVWGTLAAAIPFWWQTGRAEPRFWPWWRAQQVQTRRWRTWQTWWFEQEWEWHRLVTGLSHLHWGSGVSQQGCRHYFHWGMRYRSVRREWFCWRGTPCRPLW